MLVTVYFNSWNIYDKDLHEEIKRFKIPSKEIMFLLNKS